MAGLRCPAAGRLLAAGRLAPAARRLAALEAALRRLLRPAATPDLWIGWALRQLAAAPNRVGDVQRASGCSPTRFIELPCRVRLGAQAPRSADALQRAAAVRGRGGDVRPACLGRGRVGFGLCRPGHMSREFRRFTGLSPGEYRRAATAFPSHVACG